MCINHLVTSFNTRRPLLSSQGMRSRVLETVVVLVLLVVLVLGVAFILALLLGYAQHNTLRQTFG